MMPISHATVFLLITIFEWNGIKDCMYALLHRMFDIGHQNKIQFKGSPFLEHNRGKSFRFSMNRNFSLSETAWRLN